MAYDEVLADRVRAEVLPDDGVTERKMFGGLAFLVHGHLAVGASGQGGLLLRVDPRETESLVAEPGVGRFEMRGRAMDGWLRLSPSAVASDDELQRWVRIGMTYARSLPPK